MWLQDWSRDWFSHPTMIYYKEAQETRCTTGYWTVNTVYWTSPTSYIRICIIGQRLHKEIYEDIIYNIAWESISSTHRVSQGQLHPK